MATHSSILAWTEEAGGLQSMGSQRARHDWATKPRTAPTDCGVCYDSGSQETEESIAAVTREEPARN